MKPRISVVTIGVDDLERSVQFYRDGLGDRHGHGRGRTGRCRREARDWVMHEFNPQTFPDLVALVGGKRNASFRMVMAEAADQKKSSGES